MFNQLRKLFAKKAISTMDYGIQALQKLQGNQIANDSITPRHVDFSTQSSARVYNSATQSIPIETWTKVHYDTVDWDIQGEYDLVNNKFVSQKSGVHIITAAVKWETSQTANRVRIAVFKNGVNVSTIEDRSSNNNFAKEASHVGTGSTMVKLTKGDTIELYLYSLDAITINFGATGTYFEIAKII